MPTLETNTDKAKAIIAFITLVASVIFVDQYEELPAEVITAATTIVAYLIGLYSDTRNGRNKKDNG